MQIRAEPRPRDSADQALDVPEDVRAELDTEQRRIEAEPDLYVFVDDVPEDVVAERDLEARRGDEEMHQLLNEGRPPLQEEPRS